MKVFRSIAQWQLFRADIRVSPIGFVPTMGALHEGHLSLVKTSKQNNAFTVVSVFVNPRQFDDIGDFQAYPDDFQSDLDQLEKAGVDAVLLPDTAQIYADDYRFKVSESPFSKKLCGAQRPGHFDSVLTIVLRLLNIIQPDHAYFGEKDYQQLQLIRDMVAAFFMPVNVIACATVREVDGLAMSSRNQRLDTLQRKQAAILYTALNQSGSAEQARETLTEHGFEVDYVEDIGGRRLAAARLGDIRLIDNVQI